MKTYLDCYVCLLRQALTAARRAGADDKGQTAVINRVLAALQEVRPDMTPPEIADRIHRVIREQTGNPDPYRELKKRSTKEALALYPKLKDLISTADDPFEVAVRLAIAGNIIDFGAADEYDLWGSVQRVLNQPLAINDTLTLREAIDKANWVLFLADNAGETVFDRLLIEQITPVPVFCAVKSGPILNDATREDAIEAGLDKVARIVSVGYDALGTILERCSEEFRALYNEADVIIAKGMANYETLSAEGERVFFLLQTKCKVVADDAGVPVGSLIAKQG